MIPGLGRGESIEDVSREVAVEVHRLAARRDDLLDAGKQGLKAKRPGSEADRRLADAERKIGELTTGQRAPAGGPPKKADSSIPPPKRPR